MNKKNNKIFAACLAAAIATGSILPVTRVLADVPTPPAAPRLWGNDRYETALAISKAGWNTADTVVVVRGDEYADALCVAPLAKMYNAPILLTTVDNLSNGVEEEIKRLSAKKVIIAGGTGAVSQAVEEQLKKSVTVERIYGKDRYETSVRIAEKLGVNTTVALATGTGYADGLSIGPIAAQAGMPVLFTEKDSLPQSVKQYIADNKVTKTYIVGGTGVVGTSVEGQVQGAERLGGVNRYETNLAVMNRFSKELNFDHVYVAVGENFADALAATALAGKQAAPVVLTVSGIPQSSATFVKGQVTPKSNITLIGGETVVPTATAKAMSIEKTDYNTDGKTYVQADIKGENANIEGKNVKVEGATIEGNTYVYGNNATLSNVTVKGTVFVDPGQDGTVTLDNVTATQIRVKSGAGDSVHLKGVKAKNLVVESKNAKAAVRVVTEGKTSIENTMVKSNVVLDAQSGSFGEIGVLAQGESKNAVELKGTFDKAIAVLGKVQVKVAPGAIIQEVMRVLAAAEINADVTATVKVSIESQGISLAGRITEVILKTKAVPEFKSGLVIDRLTGTEASKGVDITIPKDIVVKQATSDLQLVGDGAGSIVKVAPGTPTGTTGGGGGGSTSTGTGTGTTGTGNTGDDNHNEKPPVIPPVTPVTPSTTKTITITLPGDIQTSLALNSATTLKECYNANKGNKIVGKAIEYLASKLSTIKINVNGEPVNQYVGDKLSAIEPGNSLSAAINTLDAKGISEYIAAHDFDSVVNNINDLTNGAVTMPDEVTVGGHKIVSIKYNDKNYAVGSRKVSFIDALNLAFDNKMLDTKISNLKTLEDTKIDDLLKKSFEFEVMGETGKYTVKATNGVFTITAQNGNIYTVTIK